MKYVGQPECSAQSAALDLLRALKAILNDPDSEDAFNQAVAAIRKAENRSLETGVRS